MTEEIDKDLVKMLDPTLKKMYADNVEVRRTECLDISMKRGWYEVDIAYQNEKGNTIEKTIGVGTIPIFGGLVWLVDGEVTEAYKRKYEFDSEYGEMMADAYASDHEERKEKQPKKKKKRKKNK